MAMASWRSFRQPRAQAPKAPAKKTAKKPVKTPDKQPGPQPQASVSKYVLFVGGDIQVERDGSLYRSRIVDFVVDGKKIVVQIGATARTPTIAAGAGHGKWEPVEESQPVMSFGFDDPLFPQGSCYAFTWEGRRCMLFPQSAALDFDKRVKRPKKATPAAA